MLKSTRARPPPSGQRFRPAPRLRPDVSLGSPHSPSKARSRAYWRDLTREKIEDAPRPGRASAAGRCSRVSISSRRSATRLSSAGRRRSVIAARTRSGSWLRAIAPFWRLSISARKRDNALITGSGGREFIRVARRWRSPIFRSPSPVARAAASYSSRRRFSEGANASAISIRS